MQGKAGSDMETGPKQANLSAGADFGLPFLPAEEANAKLVAQHQEIGDLNCASKLLLSVNQKQKERIAALTSRNAALEDAIKAISAQCVWRTTKVCDVDCGGRAFCEVEGLNPVCLENYAGAAQAS